MSSIPDPHRTSTSQWPYNDEPPEQEGKGAPLDEERIPLGTFHSNPGESRRSTNSVDLKADEHLASVRKSLRGERICSGVKETVYVMLVVGALLLLVFILVSAASSAEAGISERSS